MKKSRQNSVRIIGGAWRSRLIRFADAPGLRPSPDRVRETLFNWLGQDLTGLACLDLFAGSGALGFEAASRGASKVVMVEHSRPAVQALRDGAVQLDAKNVRVVAGDALEFLVASREAFDVAFLDPPFGAGLLPRALAALPPALAPEARVYVESEKALSALAGWQVLKQGKAGAVHYHLIQRTEP